MTPRLIHPPSPPPSSDYLYFVHTSEEFSFTYLCAFWVLFAVNRSSIIQVNILFNQIYLFPAYWYVLKMKIIIGY